MRIAFLVGEFPIFSTTFILNQITGLIDRGYEVDIYAEKPGENFKIHPDVEKYHLLDRTFYYDKMPEERLWRLLKGIGLLLVNFPKNPRLVLRSLNVFKYGKDAASLRLLYAAIALLPHLERWPYDIIHCQFGPFGLLGQLFKNLAAPQAKLITSFRGYDLSWFLRWYGENIYTKLFATGDVFFPNCDYFKRLIINLGCDEKKIVVLRSGIDCSRFFFTPRHLNPGDTIKIITIGRLVGKKGIAYGIRAVAKLIKHYPTIEYNIVGDGPLHEELQQLIAELAVGDQVKLLGAKEQQELIEILDRSHILVAPSITDEEGNQEGIPNVLKEAMAMGLPVISTEHAAIPELIEDGITGFLVPERDVDGLAEKLSYVIEHPELWIKIIQAGRTRVENYYDINQLNEQLVDVYQQLLSQDASTSLPNVESDVAVVSNH